MHPRILLLLLLCATSLSAAPLQYLLTESFEDPSTLRNWHYTGDFLLDSTVARTGKQSLKITGNGTLVYQLPTEKIGKLEFSTRVRGGWNIHVAVGNDANFDNEAAWRKTETITTDLSQDDQIFTTQIVTINSMPRVFVRLSFESTGNSGWIYLDDWNLTKIGTEVEEKIKSEAAEERDRLAREQHFRTLLATAHYDDAQKVVESYQTTYQRRIKTLGDVVRQNQYGESGVGNGGGTWAFEPTV